ncbi:UNVERIFIED_CONTAM: hypothetical protein Scaly_2035800 [Sesamum calycinum]|uniref:Ty1-copia retrotransposon protein n=1 Tax=Sesamum calycinum TaxID=2727403 RepID=A0AAW2N0U9_9LAMI
MGLVYKLGQVFRRFKESFKTSLLSITKNENDKDYPNVPIELEVPLFDEFYHLLPCTPLDALDKEARECLIVEVAEDEGIKVEAAAPEVSKFCFQGSGYPQHSVSTNKLKAKIFLMVPVAKTLPNLSKLEPLDRTNNKRWSQKLLIFFEQLDVDYVLFQNPPETPAEASTLAITAAETSVASTIAKSEDEAKIKYNKDNKTVRGHLLNHMNNSLFDLFVNYRSAKEIWTTLERRYGGGDGGRTKYLIGFTRIKRKDSKKNNQHKSFKEPNGKIQKNKQLCYCYGKPGHKAYQCYQRKDQQKGNKTLATQPTPQVNLAKKDEIIIAVVVEANLVENKNYWVLDTGASRYFYSNKTLFHELVDATDGECVFMGNYYRQSLG